MVAHTEQGEPGSTNPALWRIRWTAGAIGAGVVAAGLVVHFTMVGPGADFAADALYAVLVYLITIFALPRVRPLAAAGITYVVCVLIEVAQLTDGPAAVTAVFPLAVLILGNTFALVDLIAYAVGMTAALTCDVLMRTLRSGSR